jgi:hypothetical protein
MIHTKINNHILKTKVVTDKKDIENGMMGKTFNKGFNSMLFVMDKPYNGFWMKNCIIPLDVIFIKNGRITSIKHNCNPCIKEPCKMYKGIGELVIEVEGGTCKKNNFKKGDEVYIYL